MLVWDHKLDHTILLGGKGAAGEVDARFVEVTGYPNGGISSHFPVQEPEQEGEGRKTRSVFYDLQDHKDLQRFEAEQKERGLSELSIGDKIRFAESLAGYRIDIGIDEEGNLISYQEGRTVLTGTPLTD